MANNSKIEWTESTWNPVTGCTKVSAGCENCYAERIALRLRAMGNPRYSKGFGVSLHYDALDIPLRWKQPRTIFVNSMSDLFHPEVPRSFILEVFDVMRRASHHRFQILTKRSERLLRLAPSLGWTPNIWMGVTVERADYAERIHDLLRTEAVVKFASFEPLLGPLSGVALESLDWVIVGGESGPRARPMRPEWAVDIRDRCVAAPVPFFFKQWGGVNKKRAGRILDGRTWDEMPIISGTKVRRRSRGTQSRQVVLSSEAGMV